MRKIILIAIICFAISNGISAQNIGETWLLSKVDITETINGSATHREISATDTNGLAYFIGPKEVVFVSANELRYKRMASDDFEVFSYSKSGNTLAIELSECLLTLDMEIAGTEMSLSEHKNINENHTVIITYSYTK